MGLCEDSIEAPDHPILNGVSLRHMIEMTTSGSGSGTKLLSFTLFFSNIISLFGSYRVTITSTAQYCASNTTCGNHRSREVRGSVEG